MRPAILLLLIVGACAMLGWLLGGEAPTTAGDHAGSLRERRTSAPTLRGQVPEAMVVGASATDPTWATGGPGRMTLRGRVVTASGEPAPGADVRVFAVEPETDALDIAPTDWEIEDGHALGAPLATGRALFDGTFSISLVRNTRVLVEAELAGAGWASSHVRPSIVGAPREVTLRLLLGRRLALRVIHSDGTPAPGAYVRMARAGVLLERRTSRSGRAAFERVPEEWFAIGVSADGHSWQRHWIDLVAPHDEHEIRLLRGVSVRVQVVGLSPEVLSSAPSICLWTAREGRGDAAMRGTLDASGVCVLPNVPYGEVEDVALWGGGLRMHRRMLGDLATKPWIGPNDRDFRVEVLAPGRLSGEVRLPGGAPAAGARVSVLRCEAGGEVGGEVAYVDAGSQGTYAVEGLAPGRYVLAGRMASPRCLGLSSSYRDREGGKVEVLSGVATTEDLVLAPAGSIEGRIEGAAFPYEFDTVTVHVADTWLSASVQADGFFRLAYVPVGEAHAKSYGTERKLSSTFQVRANETTTVVLDATDERWLHGTVVDEQGAAVADVSLQLTWRNEDREREDATTVSPPGIRSDALGTFRFPVRGSEAHLIHEVVAKHASYRDLYLPLASPPASVAQPLQLRLTRWTDVVVHGQVLTPDAQPAHNARVVATKNEATSTSTTTDADGRFALPVAAADASGSLSVTHATGEGDLSLPSASEPIVIRLQPADRRAVRGWLVDSRGQPLDRYDVSLFPASLADQLPSGGRSALAGTHPMHHVHNGWREFLKAAGEPVAMDDVWCAQQFDVRGAPAGNYILVFVPDSTSDSGFLPTVHGPFVLDAHTADRAVVVRADFGESVVGRVLDEDGRPVRRATVIAGYPPKLGAASDMYRPMALTRADGRFEIRGLVRSRVDVFAWKEGYEPTRLRRVTAPANVDFVLRRGAQIRGRLLRIDGTPWVGVDLQVDHSDPQVEADEKLLKSIGGGPWLYEGRSLAPSVTTDRFGRFVFSGLASTSHRIRPETQEVDEPVMPVREYAVNTGEIDIVAPAGVAVTGQVVGLPEGHTTSITVTARQDGHDVAYDMVWGPPWKFRISPVKPGSATLVVRADALGERETHVSTDATDLEIEAPRK